jgi:hypothetical protein
MADPTQPVAPVTNTCIANLQCFGGEQYLAFGYSGKVVTLSGYSE